MSAKNGLRSLPHPKDVLVGWLNQPMNEKYAVLVKLDHFPNFRGENKTSLKPPTSYRR